ncbi:MAG: phosphate/phosphite/phosphonate ABC transporter substrate-binding protein [Dehalococcoidia bacterium]
MITIGDIDADSPAKKIERFRPLATYLAEELQEFGVNEGRVVIAQDIEQMAQFMADGTVDIYLDSTYPTLKVQELAETKIIARRWKNDVPTYWSTYVAARDGEIEQVGDFAGKILAFEEPFSTSGFILPAGTLIERGLTLTEVSGPDTTVASDEIGYFFSGDEENTFEALLQGRVSGGGVSNLDYQLLPEELKQRIVAIDQTIEVPRQLVSVRPGLPPDLATRISELLTNLDQTEKGRQLLSSLKKTRKFDLLPPESRPILDELKKLMRLVAD